MLLETGTDCYIDPAVLLSDLGWVAQPCVTEGPSPPSASWFSRWHPISNWLELFVRLVILLFNVHLFPLFFHLFTQVHLLIDGSVEDQSIITNNSIKHQSFAYTVKWSNCSISNKSFLQKSTKLNSFKYFYLKWIILFTINHLLVHSEMVKSTAIYH